MRRTIARPGLGRDAPDPSVSPWTDSAASKESTAFPVSSIDDAERIKHVLINH
jgi:hypothetical protein